MFVAHLLRQRHRRELSILCLEAVDKSIYDGPSTMCARCSSSASMQQLVPVAHTQENKADVLTEAALEWLRAPKAATR